MEQYEKDAITLLDSHYSFSDWVCNQYTASELLRNRNVSAVVMEIYGSWFVSDMIGLALDDPDACPFAEDLRKIVPAESWET
jgi:hypothetical protein